MKSLTRLMVAVAMLLLGATEANAQSTVYVFMRSATNAECTMKINGGEPFEIRGPHKKFISLAEVFHPAKKKLVFKEEGKTLFSVNYAFYAGHSWVEKTNPRDLVAEIQLNLSEGSVHYIKIGFKGLNDIQIKEVDEKEGLKLLKDKKYKELPDYIEQ